MNRTEALLALSLLVSIAGGLTYRELRQSEPVQPAVSESAGLQEWGEAPAPEAKMPSVQKGLMGLEGFNQADAVELMQVPGIGESLAKSIVEYRAGHGPFGSLEEAGQVPGIGDSRLEQIREYFQIEHKEPAVAAPASPHQDHPPTDSARLRIDLNSASAEELKTLPGIGPALALRIVEYRGRAGAFQSVSEVENVSGIGPSKLSQIAGLVVAGGEGISREIAKDSTTRDGSGTFHATGGSRVNLNTATRKQLETLPGIGETFSERIMQYRRLHGGFKQPEELKNIEGIGEKRYSRILPYIEVRSDHAR